MMQGDQYKLPIEIKTTEGNAKPATFEDLEIFVGSVRKTLGKGEVSYDDENETFLVLLTQQETFRLRGDVEVQLRCKFSDGDVVGISAGTVNFEKSTSRVVL